MKLELRWRLAFAAVAGLLLGVALVSGVSSVSAHVGWAITLVLLAGLGLWFEIPVEPYGSLNLSAVVYLVTASAYGIWDAVAVAALAPLSSLMIRYFTGSSSIRPLQTLAAGGEAALSLTLAAGLVGFPAGTNRGELWNLMQLSTVALLIAFSLSALRVAAVEGVSLGRLVRPLASRALPHLVTTLAALPVVWLTFALIGPLGIVLSVIVMVETYYPWKLLGEQRDLFMRSLQMMSNAVDLKDPYTAHHSKRVADSSVMLARALGVPEEEVARIRIGALMHDIGKIAVPGKIIRKPSSLTDDEMLLMKGHVEAGANLIEGLEILQKSADIVLHHHENYDGSGYPSMLAGEAIPLGSRIVFVADAFDALTTDRPYRKGRSPSEAVEVVRANAVKQFDPKVVETLEKVTKTQP